MKNNDFEILSRKDYAFQQRRTNRFYLLRKTKTKGSSPEGHMTIKELRAAILDKTGFDLTTIDKLERNYMKEPSFTVLLAYHRYFNVSYEYLLGEDTATLYQEYYFDHFVYGLSEESLWNLSMMNYHIKKTQKELKLAKNELNIVKEDIQYTQEQLQKFPDSTPMNEHYLSLLEKEKTLQLKNSILERNHRHLQRIQMIINYLLSNLSLELNEGEGELIEGKNSIHQFFRNFDRSCFCEFETFTDSFEFDEEDSFIYQINPGNQQVKVVNTLVPYREDVYREDNISLATLQDGLLFEFITCAKALRSEYAFPIKNDSSRKVKYYEKQKEFFSGFGYDIYRSMCISPQDIESFDATLKKRFGIKPKKKG